MAGPGGCAGRTRSCRLLSLSRTQSAQIPSRSRRCLCVSLGAPHSTRLAALFVTSLECPALASNEVNCVRYLRSRSCTAHSCSPPLSLSLFSLPATHSCATLHCHPQLDATRLRPRTGQTRSLFAPTRFVERISLRLVSSRFSVQLCFIATRCSRHVCCQRRRRRRQRLATFAATGNRFARSSNMSNNTATADSIDEGWKGLSVKMASGE